MGAPESPPTPRAPGAGHPEPASGCALARVALAGNPSDGYGGATLAMTIGGWPAYATVAPRTGGPCANPESNLVEATVSRFDRTRGTDSAPIAIRWSTTIPMTVGLGGSSAIVIATTRALCAHHGVALEPDELASFALAVETDDLGIAAGLQDRVAQAYGGLTFMDFAAGRNEALDPSLLPPLAVAWDEDAAEQSGVVHGDLRARYERGDENVHDAMKGLAGAARAARDALVAHDHQGFARAVDRTFDLRASVLDLDPRHVAMVRRARDAGAAANYTGSGGAVVAVCHGGRHRGGVIASLRDGGARTLAVDLTT
jgi:glucuronokinase